MGNNYCCAYTDKPGEDITIESKVLSLPQSNVENNINIALKLYSNQGKQGRDSLGGQSSTYSERSDALVTLLLLSDFRNSKSSIDTCT